MLLEKADFTRVSIISHGLKNVKSNLQKEKCLQRKILEGTDALEA
jgi:hypothetical protein